MKNKIVIFSLIVIFFIPLFIWKANYVEALISRRSPINDISEVERELLDTNILQSINKILPGYKLIILKNINIKLFRGIVCISGIVDTLREREKIIAIIKTVDGVRGVIDYTILRPIIRKDKDIKDEIIVSFLDNPSVYASRVQIKVLDGAVTLSGLVSNCWEKEEAENVTKGIVGVVIVKSDLLVNSHIVLSNKDLIDVIEAMIRSDEYLFNNMISLKIHQGAVILQGTVNTPFEKMRASAKISALGVKEIENNLSIEENETSNVQKGNLNFKDLEIKKSIKDIIQVDERIDPVIYDILVNDGVVKLQGIVKDVYQKSFLEQDILNVSGVIFLDNALVAQEVIRNDEHIIKDVERFLQSDSHLAGLGIIITCDAGGVNMEGEIATIEEKKMLEGIIGNVTGITKVISNIQIKGQNTPYNKPTCINKDKEPSDIMNWNIVIGYTIFQISVDRYHKTVTIQGEVKDREQKNRAEHLVRLRAPGTFSIINEISIIN